MEKDDKSFKKGVLTDHLYPTLKVAKCIVGMCSALWNSWETSKRHLIHCFMHYLEYTRLFIE